MSRDFIDTTPGDTQPGIDRPTVRRPLNGGWTLMIAAGLLAAVANYALLAGGEDPGTAVLALAEGAPPGTPVGQLQLSPVATGVDDVEAHLLIPAEDLTRLEGTVTLGRLEPGVMLRTSDLGIPDDLGRSAMSVPLDATRAVGGLLAPGDTVDVIAGAGGAQARPADYVVRGVRVLDVLTPGTGVGQAGREYAVTLSVDPDQALVLARAMREGEIDLVRIGLGTGG